MPRSAESFERAFARLEHAWVHRGSPRLRKLVLEGRAGTDFDWPSDLPTLSEELRAWLARCEQ